MHKGIELPYGGGKIETTLPEGADVLVPNDMKALENPREEIRKIIQNPIGTARLSEICKGKKSIVVVINDITRPSPSDLYLEEILNEISLVGVQDEQVTVVVATGNHRPNTAEELRKMVGDRVYSRLKIVNHNCEDEINLSYLGETRRGLPIVVNRIVAEADVKILTGIITPHQSAGYSGGRKSIMPGVAGIKALTKHHSFPIRSYDPILGQIDGNAFHEEALEAAQRVGVDFIINVVKNSKKEIVSVVGGDLVKAHGQGVRICDKSWKVQVNKKYDVVVVSPGGYPKDFDLHQSQKAISSAESLVKDQGIIILVAECRDGVGKFAKWLIDAKDPQEVIDRFTQQGFTPDHSSKAFMFARALKKSTIIMVGAQIDRNLLESMFFKTSNSIEEALETSFIEKGKNPSVLFIPNAVDCIPELLLS